MLPQRRTRRRAAAAVDPTTIRLSEHFLLSDFVGCHSVYTKGYPNVFDDPDGRKLEEGRCLAESVFEPIVAHSPVSISYGYISLDLARNIVKYQSPEKPSYHQWNSGAAADLVVHRLDAKDAPPIHIARAVDDEFPTSRVITYSESSFFCVATRVREIREDGPRKAFYENRYLGPKKKPLYQEVWKDRDAYFKEHRFPAPWRGAGYPTYHGGGIRQLHHVRVGRYAMFSDFLYSTRAVTEGYKNCPTLCANWIRKFSYVGEVYSQLLDTCGVNRLSIVRAYESPQWSDDARFHWEQDFHLWVIPPESYPFEKVATNAISLDGVRSAGAIPGQRLVQISGRFPE